MNPYTRGALDMFAAACPIRRRSAIEIQYPEPVVDGGRFPAKRCVGDSVAVSADIFRDGHDLLRAVVRYRGPGERRWREAELHRIDAQLDGVRWAGEFDVDADRAVGVHDRGVDGRVRDLAR